MGSAETVLTEIKLGGASKVSRRIDTDEDFGRSLMDGISTGDSLWLRVAGELTPASASGEASFSIALASALPHSPENVLALLGPKYRLEDVCGIPFLRADSAEVISYHSAATAALQRVRTPSLFPAREACRVALDDARDRRLERINPAYIIKNKPAAPVRRPPRRPAKRPQPVTPRDTSSSD